MSKKAADKKMMEFCNYVNKQELTSAETEKMFPIKIIKSDSKEKISNVSVSG